MKDLLTHVFTDRLIEELTDEMDGQMDPGRTNRQIDTESRQTGKQTARKKLTDSQPNRQND